MNQEVVVAGGITNLTPEGYQRILLNERASQHEILAVLARELPATTYLEVGVRDGCTVWVVTEAAMNEVPAAEGQTLILCDDWGRRHGGTGRGSHDHVVALLRAIGHRGAVEWFDGRSQQTIPARGMRFSGRVDLVHVDGDHDEEPALTDMLNCYALLRSGGAMVVHDTRWPSVTRAIQRFTEEAGVTPSLYTGGKGTAVFWRDA